MSNNTTGDDPMLISYRALRRVIGMIGIALPIVLVFGENQFGQPGILDSLSSYYWSDSMRDFFVGSLCAIGVFLGSYRGKRWDNIAGNIACFCAICVALFPCSKPLEARTWSNNIHYIAAAGLFLVFAYFCLYSFLDQDPGTKQGKMKPLRNRVYVSCGIIILACIAGMGAMAFFPVDSPVKNYVFWLESLAIWAFGWSWYIKGKGLTPIQG